MQKIQKCGKEVNSYSNSKADMDDPEYKLLRPFLVRQVKSMLATQT